MRYRAIILATVLLLMQFFSVSINADPGEENSRIYLQELRRGEKPFVKDLFGIITDKRTGLQWYCGYFMKRKDWYEIDAWAKGLRVGGGGWRLATMDELATLYPAARDSGVFKVDWTYSSIIKSSSASSDPKKDPHYSEYKITSKWWQKKGKIPSHYGNSPTVGSLSFIDGSAFPNLCGKPGTGRVRVSIAVRRNPR